MEFQEPVHGAQDIAPPWLVEVEVVVVAAEQIVCQAMLQVVQGEK